MFSRWGDYVVAVSLTLNTCSVLAYSYQGHWRQALYWIGACLINTSILLMR